MLSDKSKESFIQNFSKFQLYAIRNVLIARQTEVRERCNISPRDELLFELEKLLYELKTQYSSLQLEYIQHATECRDMDTLLRDMRTSLFNLRVAIQTFDDHDIQPLSDTTHILSQNQIQLQQFSSESKSKLLSNLHSILLIFHVCHSTHITIVECSSVCRNSIYFPTHCHQLNFLNFDDNYNIYLTKDTFRFRLNLY